MKTLNIIFIIIFVFSCSKEKVVQENLSQLIVNKDLNKIEKLIFSNNYIKNFKNFKDIYNFLNKSYFHKKCDKLFKNNKEKFKKLCYEYNNFRDIKYFDQDLHQKIYTKKDLLSLFFSEQAEIEDIIKFFYNISEKDKIIELACYKNYLLNPPKVDFNKLSENGYSIFGCFTSEFEDTKWSLIKYVAKNGGDWNLKQRNRRIFCTGKNVPLDRNITTPFANLISWKDSTNDMIKFAIKTGANWNIGGYEMPFSLYIEKDDFNLDSLKFAIKTGAKWDLKGRNPFQTLLKKKTLTFEMLKYAVETGAKWDLKFHYTPFSDLVLNPNTDLKMIKFALKTGAKIENISDLLISRAKKEEVRDYLMKLKKESLKK